MEKNNQMLWTDNLKVVAIFVVIIAHVSSQFISGIESSHESHGSFGWWSGIIYDRLSRWCVPVFIMISGFFLLNKQEDNNIFFKKRIQKILLPLIFWTCFFSLWFALQGLYSGMYILNIIKSIIISWAVGQPYYHLWFLFMLPFLYIITPFLRCLLHNMQQKELLFFIVFCFFLATMSTLAQTFLPILKFTTGHIFFTNTFLSYVGYYFLGGYIQKFSIKGNTSLCFFVFLSSALCSVLGSFFMGQKYFLELLNITNTGMSISIFFLFKNMINVNLKWGNLSKCTFGIYLIHPIFLDISKKLITKDMLEQIPPTIYIPFASFVIFFLSYALVQLFNKNKYLSKVV